MKLNLEEAMHEPLSAKREDIRILYYWCFGLTIVLFLLSIVCSSEDDDYKSRLAQEMRYFQEIYGAELNLDKELKDLNDRFENHKHRYYDGRIKSLINF